jgi:ribulose-phosphate 3-epimerase
MTSIKIAPSILSADFANLGAAIAEIADYIDMVHIDVMDGHFVPNISLGFPVIKSLRAHSDLYFDCHMMTTNPDVFAKDLVEAGGNLLMVHAEVFPDPSRVIAAARREGLDFGLAVSPPTPAEAILPYLEECSQVLVMTVHPGFGGQSFLEEVLPKVAMLRKSIDSAGLPTDIQVDGGVTSQTAPLARAAGANVFVAGSAIFAQDNPVAACKALRELLETC